MIVNMTGSSSGGLNVKVVAYSVTPTGVAAENTIGVVTDTAITGWVMQAEQPENPTDGMVWIKVDFSSTSAFYADKKNMIKVYPVVAYQYIGGTWAIKDSYIYQNAAWVILFNSYIYYYGNEFESLTGGWIRLRGTIIKGTDGITMKSKSITTNIRTANKLDLTDFDTLSAYITNSTANWFYIGVTQSDDDYFNEGNENANWPTTTPYVRLTKPSSTFTANLNISALSGLYKVVIANRSDTTSEKTMIVRSVQLTTS